MNETGVFALEIIQHDRWPPDTAEIQALIRVTATPGDHPGDGLTAAGLAEIIIMDCSGSMGKPPGKLRAAKRAAHAAVDTMRDGVEFAVLSGRSRAEAVYPHGPALALSAPDTRDAAKRAIDRLYPNDGTKISSWLRQAHRLLRPYPRHIRHAMLYTDGQNHDLQDGRLDQVLDACRGVFTCDARGIGDQWEPRDLRKIVTVLQGRADGLPDPADLEDDFRVVMREAMRKVVPSVALRIRTRPGVSVREIRQMYPADADLTGHGTAADTTATDFWIGSWSDETRDYMVRLGVAPGDFAIGKEVRLARVDVTVPGPDGPRILPGPGFIVACWTRDDLSMRTWLPSDTYVSQQAAGDAITAGCHAWLGGDAAGAAAAWGEAARLASAANDAERLGVLQSLVQIVDAGAGRVRLRDDLSRAVVLQAEARAPTSSFVPDQDPRPRDRPTAGAGTPPVCPGCGRTSPLGARFCERCGRRLDEAGPDRDGTA